MTRTGKIARLPRTIRHQLNTRLQDGEEGSSLLDWLNSLPEVQAVLAAQFDSRPVNPQNLSDWKQGGYHDWLLQQEALEMAQRLAEDAAELHVDGRPPLTDTLALALAARYALAIRDLPGEQAPVQWRRLRELCADIVELRRGDQAAARLRLDCERFEEEIRAAKAADEAAKPKPRSGGLSPEALLEIERAANLL